MGVVEQPIADRIGDGSLSEMVMPVLNRQLAGEERGAEVVAVLEDLEQIAAIRVPQGCQPPVIQSARGRQATTSPPASQREPAS